MKKLKIAQISPLRFSVPAEKRGGNERIISYLTEELIKRGHKVTLFAPKNSKTKAKLISLTKKGTIDLGFTTDIYWWNIFNHSFAFEKASEFDIIHCHWDIMGAFFQRFVKTPVLHTIHYVESPRKSVQDIYRYYKDDLNIVFISNKQKNNNPIKFKNSWLIYNGINTSKFKFSPKAKEYFVWVGRFTSKKHPEEAIKLAKKTGITLLLAGQMQESEAMKQYFKKKIKPELNSKIRYIGELSQKELSNLYGSAKGCLFPSGLVKIESLSCGTPVIVLQGKKRKIKLGKIGFAVKNIQEAVKAVKNIDKINRQECRKWVEKNFSVEKMTDKYEKVYYEILEKQKNKKTEK